MKILLTVFLTLLVPLSIGHAADRDLVEEADQLKSRIGSERLVLLDVRPGTAYEQGHLPGARSVNLAAWKLAFDSGGEPHVWSLAFGRLGIAPDSRVVVYDETFSPSAARAWWLLRYWGGENAAILNGGVRAWLEAGGEIDRTPNAPIENAAPFPAVARPDRLTTTEAIREKLAKKASPTLVDTRSPAEFAAGCLPGAVRLEWTELVNPVSGKLLDADALRAKFAAAGVDTEGPVVTYCRSGGRASVALFALEWLGAERATNYYGSWNAWTAPPVQDPAAVAP